jgi:hypothetical protein
MLLFNKATTEDNNNYMFMIKVPYLTIRKITSVNSASETFTD